MQRVTLRAMSGDVDFPMLYIVLNSRTRVVVGAMSRVGTPAWEKHAMKPV